MEQLSIFDRTQYDDFVEKFKPKKTTDDCYTPPRVFEAVKRWAVARYGLEGREIIRPFYPGGDFERHDYPEGCVVLDNPPFSILTKIYYFYLEKGIDFFLFAPGLCPLKDDNRLCYVICGSRIKYENNATIQTAFVTNMGKNKIETAPELGGEIEAIQGCKRKTQEQYIYPKNLLTAAMCDSIAKRGIKITIPKNTPTLYVKALDFNREKSIFGGGFLLGEKTAQELDQVKVTARMIELSPREKALVEYLTKRESAIKRMMEEDDND